MDQWSKTTSHLRRDSDNLQYGELRSDCGTRFVKFIFWIVIHFKDTFETGESFLIIFFILIFFTPTVGEMSDREREDTPNSDISPVPVSELVDDRTGEPVETQAKQIPKSKEKTTIER